MGRKAPVRKNCTPGRVCKGAQARSGPKGAADGPSAAGLGEILDGKGDAALDRQGDILDQEAVVLGHAALDPVQHQAHKAVLVKAGDEGFLLLGDGDALALFDPVIPENREWAEKAVPTLFFNLTLTKEIGDAMRISFFANNMFRSTPLWESTKTPGSFVRRNANTFYFGAALSLTIR